VCRQRVLMKSLRECRLYTFVDTAYLHGRSVESVAQQLCEGGSDLIQLRAKNLPTAEIRRLAEAILPITEGNEVGLVINDYTEIALETGSLICHLGQEDFFEAGHRHVSELIPSGSKLRIGLSSHAPAQAERALDADADYVAIGPVYQTGTKPTAQPVTLNYVRWAASNVPIPWFAIGGINLRNLDEVLDAGARRICVVSAILNARDIVKACQEFKKRLTSRAI
jgi:thiamine-phosphate pyrophosphorylase